MLLCKQTRQRQNTEKDKYNSYASLTVCLWFHTLTGQDEEAVFVMRVLAYMVLKCRPYGRKTEEIACRV